MEIQENNRTLQYAIKYAQLGLAVFPLKPKDKRPLGTTQGYKSATTDITKIQSWWSNHPNRGIGIATGSKSNNLVVIDLDIDNQKGIDGAESLYEWEKAHEELPQTVQVITGRGGYHLYYFSDRKEKTRVGLIDGIDVRGEGGYVVAPPSIHSNGTEYAFEFDIEEFEIAKVNTVVRKFLDQKNKQDTQVFKLTEKIKKGERNQAMFQLACSMQSRGDSDKAIWNCLKTENIEKCENPLSDRELKIIYDQALKYEKGTSIRLDLNNRIVETRPPKLDKTDKGAIKPTVNNFREILEHDEFLANKIKYNSHQYNAFLVGAVPWEQKITYREWNNFDDNQLINYIEKRYGINNEKNLITAFNVVLNNNMFNPIVDNLNLIYQKFKDSDLNGAIDNLAPKWLGVEKNQYTSEVMKIFLLGAIKRVFEPGCKFDYMLILQGEQGSNKSTFLRKLALSDNWFNDNLNVIDSDKGIEKIQGIWIAEIAELGGIKRAKDIESIKAFITTTSDYYRAPYSRRASQRPRQCVITGSVNGSHFLTDKTGNRRYLILKVDPKNREKEIFENMEEFETDIEKAYAEAMTIYKSENYKLILSKDSEDVAEKIRILNTEEDVRVGMIRDYLNNRISEDAKVCIMELWENALGEFGRPSRKESNELHDIMLSFKDWALYSGSSSHKSRCLNYGIQVCYTKIP